MVGLQIRLPRGPELTEIVPMPRLPPPLCVQTSSPVTCLTCVVACSPALIPMLGAPGDSSRPLRVPSRFELVCTQRTYMSRPPRGWVEVCTGPPPSNVAGPILFSAHAAGCMPGWSASPGLCTPWGLDHFVEFVCARPARAPGFGTAQGMRLGPKGYGAGWRVRPGLQDTGRAGGCDLDSRIRRALRGAA